ncbi:MAG TPA: BrnT family toxin [Stellaceae bacterium]
MAEIEFDPQKNRANLEKHGIDLPTAAHIWNDVVLEREDDRRDYGETRIAALGAVEERVLVVVYTGTGAD